MDIRWQPDLVPQAPLSKNRSRERFFDCHLFFEIKNYFSFLRIFFSNASISIISAFFM
jgi:hypothetical protein